MLRAVLGVSALAVVLAFGATQMSAVAAPPAASAAKKAVKLEDKYATSPDGVKIHYVASGKGPLVVMIHGFPDFSGSWAQLTPKLNDAYRVVALDTRGYNLSGQPVGVENYKTPKLVADVQAVIEAEGYKKATVIGHDWGALISWEFAFAHPETLERLIILSVPHPDSFAVQLATNKQQQENSAYARNFQKEGSEKNLTAEGLAGWVKDPEMKPKYVEAFKRSSFAAMMNYYRANYPDGANAPKPEDKPVEHPKINVPVLVIHGMKDTALLSAGHNNTWEHISKDTTLLMVPDAGHFVQHDAEALVNAQIRSWLDLHPVK
ncbi:MAG: alpha/beta hydrolase [Hyphomonadaceae bacterium]